VMEGVPKVTFLRCAGGGDFRRPSALGSDSPLSSDPAAPAWRFAHRASADGLGCGGGKAPAPNATPRRRDEGSPRLGGLLTLYEWSNRQIPMTSAGAPAGDRGGAMAWRIRTRGLRA